MNENVNTNMDEVMNESNVEEQAVPETATAEVQPTMLDLPTAINTVIARTEATAIAVSIVNAFLDVIQKRDSAFAQEDLEKIQAAVNFETNKTDALYREIERVLAANAAQSAPAVEEDSDSAESEKTE